MGVLKVKVGGVWVPVSQGVSSFSAGFVGDDKTSGSVALSLTLTDAGARVTFTADPTRRYKTTALLGPITKDATAAIVSAFITSTVGGGTLLIGRSTYIPASQQGFVHVELVETGLSGTITRNLQAISNAGGGTIGAGSYVLVEDITTIAPGGVLTTPWTDVTFQNGWTNFGGGYQTCQYRKVGDIVYLRGLMTHATGNSVAFTLPAGFRPPAALEYPCVGDIVTGTQRINPNPNGAVAVVAKGNVWLSGSFAV